MAILVATTSLPAVYRPNGYAQTTTAGTPHARANKRSLLQRALVIILHAKQYDTFEVNYAVNTYCFSIE